MTDENYNPRRSRIPAQPRIRYGEQEGEETPTELKITPLERMTLEDMIIIGLITSGAVLGSGLAGAIVGWFGGSLVGFKTGVTWGRRSTKSK